MSYNPRTVQAVRELIAHAPAPVAQPKSLDDLLPEQRNPHIAEVRAHLATTQPTEIEEASVDA